MGQALGARPDGGISVRPYITSALRKLYPVAFVHFLGAAAHIAYQSFGPGRGRRALGYFHDAGLSTGLLPELGVCSLFVVSHSCHDAYTKARVTVETRTAFSSWQS